MRCRECGHNDSKVIESRDLDDAATIRRRRQCLDCGARFTTYERPESPVVVVVKKDGRRELFSRGKVATGIYRAIEKRPIPLDLIEDLISKIEREVRSMEVNELPSTAIGELVLIKLKNLDEVAYVRFASVYRQFASVEQFEQELNHLREHLN